jgi:hypothetical protein
VCRNVEHRFSCWSTSILWCEPRPGVPRTITDAQVEAVFVVDEKPQIQALQRTAPVLPMIPGVPERRSHDYVRHGTIDLFAALNTVTGEVIGKLSAQYRGHQRRFEISAPGRRSAHRAVSQNTRTGTLGGPHPAGTRGGHPHRLARALPELGCGKKPRRCRTSSGATVSRIKRSYAATDHGGSRRITADHTDLGSRRRISPADRCRSVLDVRIRAAGALTCGDR